MFYPVDSLKRGGRFYLLWLADSWPDRFATITQRQLWSHDIRKLCDDLMKVMTNESGRPVNRFSLRLSSQLMRGLVRVYQRKVSLYLADLCMINASVFRHTNKKWQVIDKDSIERLHQPLPRLVAQELPEEAQVENEQQVAQLIENSGNVVANVQDITLKESVIPDIRLPTNDDFGEENPDQALRLALGWPVEAMLGTGADSVPHVSAMSAALEVTDPDLSRLNATQHMEPHAEMDVTLFNKSVGPELAAREFDKDIPEIPEIPIPEISVPVPQAEKSSPERPIAVVPMIVEEQAENAQKLPETQAEIELQELEEIPAKRRRKHKLIVDKTKKIDPKVLQARINNPKVELRCEDASDDVIQIRIPVDIYFRRLAHAGYMFKNNITHELNRLFLRNLGVIPNPEGEEREFEVLRAQLGHRRLDRSVLERIEEETVIHDKTGQPVDQQIDQPIQMDTTKDGTFVVEPMHLEQEIPDLRVSMQPERHSQVDISDLPTQKLDQSQGEKRRTDDDNSARKRLRASSYKSFSLSQRRAEIDNAEAEKENIPANQQSPTKSPDKSQRHVLTMLEQAGIVDVPETRQTIEVEPSRIETNKRNSEGSETPLGSLDRTKVSLGDSDKTTDSIRFIRKQWGTEGTMCKIMKAVAFPEPVTVWRLVCEGPTLQGMTHLAAARCFNSILKLKQHGFIIVRKDPDTLEINNIILGPRFD